MSEKLERLRQIYIEYDGAVSRLLASKGLGDGLFGMGSDPAQDPCHARFDEAVEAFVGEAAQACGEAEAAELVNFLLSGEKPELPLMHWPLIAAQRHSLPLIPRLTPAAADEALTFYRKRYAWYARLPAQKKVFDALKRRAAGEEI